MSFITRTEEFLLLTVGKCGDEASGMQIRKAMEQLTGRSYSIGGIYVPLDRLVRKGLLHAKECGPSPERGGRRKRVYEVTGKGIKALQEVRRIEEQVWSNLPDLLTLRLGLSRPK